MILSALNDYYERKAAVDPGALPRFGFERIRIPFLIVVGENGEFLGFGEVDKNYVAPEMASNTKNPAPNLLWSKPEYALGAPDSADARKKRGLFAAEIRKRLPESSRDNDGVRAVLRFLENPDFAASLAAIERARPALWSKMIEKKGYLTFALFGESRAVFESESVRAETERSAGGGWAADKEFFCPLAGESVGDVARLHPKFAIAGARANFVSFNKDAFCSYGKKQGDNAPIGARAVFRYTTALRHLLRPGSRQKTTIGDTTVIFWAKEKSDEFAENIGALFDKPKRDDVDDGRARIVKRILDWPRAGGRDGGDSAAFYALGLGVNRVRAIVRFWRASTMANVADNIRRHFDNIALDGDSRFSEYPGAHRLLESIVAPKGKTETPLPPYLIDALTGAILEGRKYPPALFTRALSRCRVVVRGKDDNEKRAEEATAHYRAALLKGCLIRNFEKDVLPMLNKDETDLGYRFGRLFAALERLQERASGGRLNTTIRDSYYAAASTTPARVFGRLMNGRIAHLAKLRKGEGKDKGFAKFVANLIDETVDAVGVLPARFSPQEQGMFHLGYCHQRRDFWRSSPKHSGGDSAETNQQENDNE